MTDQPMTLIVLAQFYRQVMLPDVERAAGAAVQGCERYLREELHNLQLAVRAEIHDLKAGVERLHEDIRRLEERMEP